MIIQVVQALCLIFHYVSRVTSSVTIRKYKQNRFSFHYQPYNSELKNLKNVSTSQRTYYMTACFQTATVCSFKTPQTKRKYLNQSLCEQQTLILSPFSICFIIYAMKQERFIFSLSYLLKFYSSRGVPCLTPSLNYTSREL